MCRCVGEVESSARQRCTNYLSAVASRAMPARFRRLCDTGSISTSDACVLKPTCIGCIHSFLASTSCMCIVVCLAGALFPLRALASDRRHKRVGPDSRCMRASASRALSDRAILGEGRGGGDRCGTLRYLSPSFLYLCAGLHPGRVVTDFAQQLHLCVSIKSIWGQRRQTAMLPHVALKFADAFRVSHTP